MLSSEEVNACVVTTDGLGFLRPFHDDSAANSRGCGDRRPTSFGNCSTRGLVEDVSTSMLSFSDILSFILFTVEAFHALLDVRCSCNSHEESSTGKMLSSNM